MTDSADADRSNQPRRRRQWWQFSLRGLFLLVTLCAVGLYIKGELEWQRKKGIAERWAVIAIEYAATIADSDSHEDLLNPNPLGCPEPLEQPEQLEVLRIGMTSLPKTTHRVACVKLLVELYPDKIRGLLRQVVTERNRPEVRTIAMRILSLFRQLEDVDLMLPLLNDRVPEVRAAAADCVGIIHRPAYEIPLPGGLWGREATMVSDPPIRIHDLIGQIGDLRFPGRTRYANEHIEDREIAVAPEVRQEIERMMLNGETSDERVAAARALVAWPPEDYRLRVAEWGVWLDDGGELRLAKSVIDEIPGFVHRTCNSVASFGDRVNGIMVITKPVVHITSDRPLAVDLEVMVNRGRPWFAYPRPDDFTVQVEDVGEDNPDPDLTVFDRPGAPQLTRIAEGFPWLRPSYRIQGSTGGWTASRNGLVGVGLRWQSLIVSPQQLPWMTLPELDDDSRFAWWGTLRQVPSSWISSQGEAERFLYYDGPTLAKAPLRFGYDGRQVSWCECKMFGPGEEEPEVWRTDPTRETAPRGSTREQPSRQGFFLRVKGDRVTARRFDFAARSGNAGIAEVTPIDGTAATDAFLRMLTDYGLTPDEAGGLFRAWEKQFLHTDGTRLITLLLRSDYDRLCPLTVRPTPTETVRLGLLLTEFDAGTDQPAK